MYNYTKQPIKFIVMDNFLGQNVLSSGLIPEDKKNLISSFITWRREMSGERLETFQDFLDYVSSPEKITLGIRRMALHRYAMGVMLEIFCKNNTENFQKFLDLIPMRSAAKRKKKKTSSHK